MVKANIECGSVSRTKDGGGNIKNRDENTLELERIITVVGLIDAIILIYRDYGEIVVGTSPSEFIITDSIIEY